MAGVLDTMACLQAQYAPAMYVGLWSRMADLERGAVTKALEDRTVAQGTLMRVTIHLASARDYWPIALAIRDARRAAWARFRQHQVTPDQLTAAADRLRTRLEADGTITRKEMEAFLGRELAIGVGLWVDLVRVPPSGTWERRRADLFGLADQWLGPPPPGLTVEAAQDHVVRRYLGGFGPALPKEIADWSGLPLAAVKAVLDRLPGLRGPNAQPGLRGPNAEPGLRGPNAQPGLRGPNALPGLHTFGKLVDLADAPLPPAETPAPVRFLPVWDASLLVHCRRAAILREEHRPLVFNTKTPHSVNTFLVDGVVAGTWRYEKGGVNVTPFEPLTKAVTRQVNEEADRLAAFHS